MRIKKENDKKEIVNFYKEEAAIYDVERFSTPQGKYVDITQKDILLNMVDSWEDKKILEVGCGTGRFSIEIVKHGGVVTGLDPSITMLKKLGEKIKINYISLGKEIDFVNASGYELPFSDDTFDGCICINVVNHLPDYNIMLNEVHRILKPNGFFVINIPNIFSLYLPVALLVNIRKRSVYNDVYSQWFTLPRIIKDFHDTGFKVNEIKGSAILPAFIFPKKLIFLLKRLDKISRGSFLRYVTGSIFIKAECDKE